MWQSICIGIHMDRSLSGEVSPVGQSASDVPAPNLSLEEGTHGESEIILLVEDEAFVRDVASEVLRAAGYGVLIAKNAAEALQAYEQCSGHLDLLLTDIILPGQNGRTLAQALKQRRPEIRILLMSGYEEQLGSELGHELECLPKPFSARTLLERVRKVLDGKHCGRSEYEPMPAFGNA